MKTTYQKLFDRKWDSLFEKLSETDRETVLLAPGSELAHKLIVESEKYAEEMENHLADHALDQAIVDSK
jgi:hypothetical protein